jgi:hypothetical protein
MNNFRKLFKNNNVLFGEVFFFFFNHIISINSLAHDHGLLWIKNAPMFVISLNKNIKKIVNKYITTNHYILQIKICAAQIYQG